MTKSRIAQVQELLKRELGQILLREIEMPEGALVTLTRVVASGNLQEVKVYLSVVPDAKAQAAFKILQENIWAIQQILNERLKMRPVPRIQWVRETATIEAHHIEKLLEKIEGKR